MFSEQWQPCFPDDAALLEREYCSGTVSFLLRGVYQVPYSGDRVTVQVDFEASMQVNLRSQYPRRIRRNGELATPENRPTAAPLPAATPVFTPFMPHAAPQPPPFLAQPKPASLIPHGGMVSSPFATAPPAAFGTAMPPPFVSAAAQPPSSFLAFVPPPLFSPFTPPPFPAPAIAATGANATAAPTADSSKKVSDVCCKC